MKNTSQHTCHTITRRARFKLLIKNFATLTLLGIVCIPTLLTAFLYLQLGISGELASSVSKVISG